MLCTMKDTLEQANNTDSFAAYTGGSTDFDKVEVTKDQLLGHMTDFYSNQKKSNQ